MMFYFESILQIWIILIGFRETNDFVNLGICKHEFKFTSRGYCRFTLTGDRVCILNRTNKLSFLLVQDSFFLWQLFSARQFFLWRQVLSQNTFSHILGIAAFQNWTFYTLPQKKFS